jgi:uncharacterized membrane protein
MPTIPEISLNKNRLEALSDGVFAIVMTLLVIEIKVPELTGKIDTAKLIKELEHSAPLFISYFLTFAVISVLWLSHHFLFHSYAKSIDRGIIQLNVIFLAFISLIPFSSHFLGLYFNQPLAIAIFGFNALLAYGMIYIMRSYAIRTKHIETAELPKRVTKQGTIRMLTNIICTLVGIGFGIFNTWVGIFFLLLPVFFNAVPGSLNFLEKIFGFDI